MGIKQLYNDNLRKLPNEYGDVSVLAVKANVFFLYNFVLNEFVTMQFLTLQTQSVKD